MDEDDRNLKKNNNILHLIKIITTFLTSLKDKKVFRSEYELIRMVTVSHRPRLTGSLSTIIFAE
jgi:hypothetical protein